MAVPLSPQKSLLLVLSFYFPISTAHPPTTILLPITKDPSTLQYLTTIHHGTPLAPVTLAVDLNGPFLWRHCLSSASSRRPATCRSIQCLAAKGQTCNNFSCPTATDACRLVAKNPITHAAAEGELSEDIVGLHSETGEILPVHNFLFSCAPPNLSLGLAAGAEGVLGLGRTRIALPSQDTGFFRRKFSLCLSSSEGAMIAGEPKPNPNPKPLAGILESLTYTPLVKSQADDAPESYYINVKSIAVNGKKLPIGGVGAVAKISTTVPYTTMESSIYRAFADAFVEAALSTNATRVAAAAAAPLGVCFREGFEIPAVELALQSEMVRWKFGGGNLMVRVREGVVCLGFMEGGKGVVLGGQQLEENFLRFDLGTSMLGFSSSLFGTGLSCSDLRSNYGAY